MKFDRPQLIVLTAVIAALVAIEWLCFGPIITHVGFYLDDWATLKFLHFAPKEGGYPGLLQYYLLKDDRVLIRPLEVLHYGTIYYLCGDRPLGYHVFNAILEVLTSIQLYLISLRLTGKKCAAFAAALLLLLYPGHDSTHYWVICSSVALSLALYLGSFQLALRGTDNYLGGESKKAAAMMALSFLLFFASLLNYETFLPLAATTALAAGFIAYRRSSEIHKFIRAAILAGLPSALSVVALLFWLKVVVPRLGHGYAHPITLNAATMVGTLTRGIQLSSPHEWLPFFFSQAQNAVAAFTTSEEYRLMALLTVALAGISWLARRDADEAAAGQAESGPDILAPWQTLILGLVTIVLSYTIFGLSPDYMPTFITLVNRVNMGATVGLALVVAALYQWCAQLFMVKRKLLYFGICTGVSIFATLLFALADWGMAKPWIVSWTTQKEVRQAITQLRGKVDDRATLLLVSCPRYVMWSPVFDGVWDFQNMVRITLDKPDFNANVVSERMSVTAGGIKDVSYGYECGVYPFDKLYLMVAPHPELYPVTSGEQFADMVEQRGMTFGLDKKTLSKWRAESRLLEKPKSP